MQNRYHDATDANYQATYFDTAPLQPIQPRRRGGHQTPRGIIRYLPTVRRHHYPKLAVLLFLWLFGLYAMFLASAPFATSTDNLAAIVELRQQLDQDQEKTLSAMERDAELALSTAKTWFWWANEQQRKVVREKQAVWQEAYSRVEQKRRSQRQTLLTIKHKLGLWSQSGVTETRQLFWKSFNDGKLFARRQTLWDALFHILSAREKPSFSVLLELLFTTMINFTTGMLFSFFIFIAKLPSTLMEYSPSLISGFLFFVTATVAAMSVVSTFLATMYTAGAAAAYGLTSLFLPTRRLDGHQPRYYAVNYHVD